MHIWWDCSRIQEYWEEVLEYMEEITGERIPKKPLTCLFHYTNKTKKQFGKTLVPVLLNAAKGLIPKNWLHPKRPSIKEWIQRVDFITEMEYLGQGELGGEARCRAAWEKWRAFKTSEKFAQALIETDR